MTVYHWGNYSVKNCTRILTLSLDTEKRSHFWRAVEEVVCIHAILFVENKWRGSAKDDYHQVLFEGL